MFGRWSRSAEAARQTGRHHPANTQSQQLHRPGAAQVDKAALHIGAVAFIHRFGSSLKEHVHFHVRAVDVVFKEVAVWHWTPRNPPFVVVG